jgi:hypothetical protein
LSQLVRNAKLAVLQAKIVEFATKERVRLTVEATWLRTIQVTSGFAGVAAKSTDNLEPGITDEIDTFLSGAAP